MTRTQMTLMEVEINEIRSTLSSGDSRLLIFSAFKFAFFQTQPSGAFLGEGVLEMCGKFTGELPFRSTILIKLQTTLSRSRFGVGVSCGFSSCFRDSFS